MANALSFLADPEYWRSVRETAPNSLGKLAQGLAVNTVNTVVPVDLVNMALRPMGLGSDNPILGQNHLAKLLNVSPDDPSFNIGAMLPTDPTDLAHGLPVLAGIFAGKGAKTADALMLAKAQDMAKAGMPAPQIWKETGWALDTPDKLPRFEIPDNAASISKSALPYEVINGSKVESWNLGDSLNHPDIYSAYPDAKNIEASFSANNGASYNGPMDWISYNNRMKQPLLSIEQRQAIAQSKGEFDALHASPEYSAYNKAIDDAFNLNPNITDAEFNAIHNSHNGDYLNQRSGELFRKYQDIKDQAEAYPRSGNSLGSDIGADAKSVTIHELQHAIQQREGFARGGSPESLRQLVSIDNMMQGKPKPTDADVYGAYQRLAGEAEARLTEARMDLTPEQRLAQYPYDPAYFEQATGVPLNSLIVRKEGGTAMSVPDINIERGRYSWQVKNNAGDVLKEYPASLPKKDIAQKYIKDISDEKLAKEATKKRYAENKIKNQQVKIENSALREFLNSNKDRIEQLHKQPKINFTPVDDSIFSQKQSINIYQSPSYGKKQGSSYKLVMIDGRPAYARQSDHWGDFSARSSDDFDKWNDYNWTLPGSEKGKRQTGVIFLDEYQ